VEVATEDSPQNGSLGPLKVSIAYHTLPKLRYGKEIKILNLFRLLPFACIEKEKLKNKSTGETVENVSKIKFDVL